MNEGMTKCPGCGAPVRRAGGRGRPKVYCSDACRKAASRSRATSWEWMQENKPQLSTWSNDDLGLGDETPVPYIEVDVSEDEEHLILATLDPIGAMAETDAEMLAGLLAELGDVPEFDAEDVSASRRASWASINWRCLTAGARRGRLGSV